MTTEQAITPFMRVRALMSGYYGHGPQGEIYRAGQQGEFPGVVFTITPREIIERDYETNKPKLDEKGEPRKRLITCEQQFSSAWMERVDDDTPETLATAQEIIRRSEGKQDMPAMTVGAAR